MDYKNYKHAFQQIRFSEHLEEDILSNLEKRNNKKSRTKLFSRVIFTSATALCALTLIVTLNRLDSLDCDLLSENSLAELDNISNISICQTTTTENQKVEIPDHEMVILDPASEIEKNKIVSFSGETNHADSNYEIGYIYNGTYNKLDGLNNNPSFDEAFCTTDTGKYYMCISNYSAQELSFDTKLIISTNDLIYHTNSIYLSKDSSIIIQTDLFSENCIAYYIENCQTKKLTKIQSSTKKAAINADGSYRIFGITSQNTIIDLKDCLSIEHSVTQSDSDSIIPLCY